MSDPVVLESAHARVEFKQVDGGWSAECAIDGDRFVNDKVDFSALFQGAVPKREQVEALAGHPAQVAVDDEAVEVTFDVALLDGRLTITLAKERRIPRGREPKVYMIAFRVAGDRVEVVPEQAADQQHLDGFMTAWEAAIANTSMINMREYSNIGFKTSNRDPPIGTRDLSLANMLQRKQMEQLDVHALGKFWNWRPWVNTSLQMVMPQYLVRRFNVKYEPVPGNHIKPALEHNGIGFKDGEVVARFLLLKTPRPQQVVFKNEEPKVPALHYVLHRQPSVEGGKQIITFESLV